MDNFPLRDFLSYIPIYLSINVKLRFMDTCNRAPARFSLKILKFRVYVSFSLFPVKPGIKKFDITLEPYMMT